MPEFPRDRPHLYLRNNRHPEAYTTRLRLRATLCPTRTGKRARPDSEALTVAPEAQLKPIDKTAMLSYFAGTPGFYLDFEIPAGSEKAAELLENRLEHIKLVHFPATRQDPAGREQGICT